MEGVEGRRGGPVEKETGSRSSVFGGGGGRRGSVIVDGVRETGKTWRMRRRF